MGNTMTSTTEDEIIYNYAGACSFDAAAELARVRATTSDSPKEVVDTKASTCTNDEAGGRASMSREAVSADDAVRAATEDGATTTTRAQRAEEEEESRASTYSDAIATTFHVTLQSTKRAVANDPPAAAQAKTFEFKKDFELAAKQSLDELRHRITDPGMEVAWHGGKGFGSTSASWVRLPNGLYANRKDIARDASRATSD